MTVDDINQMQQSNFDEKFLKRLIYSANIEVFINAGFLFAFRENSF